MDKDKNLIEATAKALQNELLESKDINDFKIIWNRGAVERTPMPNEKVEFTGTDVEFLEFLDDNFVYVDTDEFIDENNNMIGTLDDYFEDYEENNDPSGETILITVIKNGKTIYESDYDLEEDEDYDDYDYELNYEIEVIDSDENDGECPYLSGYATSDDEDFDEDDIIFDRNDLSEDGLWLTGWGGFVQNTEEGPFKSFNDMDIECYDNEKGGEYDLPEIPENIQKEFLQKVNKWIEENE